MSKAWPMQQGNEDELRQMIMGKDEFREMLNALLEHVVFYTNAAMRSAREVLM